MRSRDAVVISDCLNLRCTLLLYYSSCEMGLGGSDSNEAWLGPSLSLQ